MDSDSNVLKNLILSQSHILSYLLDLSESNNSFMMSILTSFIVENNSKNPEKVSSLLRTITQNNDIKKELLELKKKFETLYISPNQNDYDIYSNKVKIVKNELTNLQKVLLILSPDNIDTYNESIGILDVDSHTITKDDVETLEDELVDKTKSELINETKNEIVENIIDEFKEVTTSTDTTTTDEINTERLDNLKNNIIEDILVENNITKDDDEISLFEDLINANASDSGVVYDLNQAYTEITTPEPEPLQNNNTENSKDILNTIINHLVLDTEQKAETPNVEDAENIESSNTVEDFNDIIEPAVTTSENNYQVSNEFSNLFEEINKQVDSLRKQ